MLEIWWKKSKSSNRTISFISPSQ